MQFERGAVVHFERGAVVYLERGAVVHFQRGAVLEWLERLGYSAEGSLKVWLGHPVTRKLDWLTLLYSERPKLPTILAVLSAIVLTQQ